MSGALTSTMSNLESSSVSGGAMPQRRPAIGIIALSQIPDDPRVRRQGDAFSRAGWNVVGIGLGGSRSSRPGWLLLDESDLPPAELPQRLPMAEPKVVLPLPKQAGLQLEGLTLGQKLLRLALAPDHLYFATRKRIFEAGRRAGLRAPDTMRLSRAVARQSRRLARIVAHGCGLVWAKNQAARRVGQARYVLRMQSPRISPRAAETAFWTLNSRFEDLYRLGATQKPDIWLANDWTALPIARRLARENGGILVYDTHELAADEYTERLRWRLLHRPVTVGVERQGMAEAALVTCVSDGIADRLQELYSLKERPLVIRNTPIYQEMPFRPTGERIEVLYHGIVSPGRGLEECIQSVAKWKSEFRLTIRGPASDSYKAQLESAIASAGVRDRVQLAPPVPMVELVRAANAFDVGLFALPDHSRHNRFALPNKFFEYTMAGLALCVSDLPEMARLVKKYDLGILFSGMDPAVIAASINSLDRATIDRYKRLSLAAAKDLNWQEESQKLVSLCEKLVNADRKS